MMSIDLMPEDVFNIATILCARIRLEAEGSSWFVDEMLPTQAVDSGATGCCEDHAHGSVQALPLDCQFKNCKICFLIFTYQSSEHATKKHSGCAGYVQPRKWKKHPLLVSGSLYSSVNFTVPPHLLFGVLGQ